MSTDELLQQCPFCGSKEITNAKPIFEQGIGGLTSLLLKFQCPICGEIAITQAGIRGLELNQTIDKHLISCYIRERDWRGRPVKEITHDNIKELVESIAPPQNISDKMDRLILYLGTKAGQVGKPVQLNPMCDYVITYSKNPTEFDTILHHLRDNGILVRGAGGDRFTVQGWQAYEALERTPKIINQAFVAMWFGGNEKRGVMDQVYNDGLKKAIEDADIIPKMKALKIDLLQHNDPIDTRILSEIRRSKFVVADFTEHRGGVYFEAGYALALGIPVIWTCSKEDSEKTHFDVRQFNRIEWNNVGDLYAKLRRRIEGTIF